MAGGKVYTFEEVRKHNDRKDCWLIIAGKRESVQTACIEYFHEKHSELLGPECLGLSSYRFFLQVYDVTPFMEEHPGGDEVLLASTGKDATADYEDIGHSESAKEMMLQYCIGEVDVATIPAKITYTVPMESSPKKAETSSGTWATLLQLTTPLLLLVLAFALQSFLKAKTE
ncbi:hypothetical protein EJB05_20546 [Eragrostis curvula]|uniref:Cytochrome b5 heme-binding domain-containing protein n=1 Tax=Eragrostis curvula TaxID=38414 RepID=A0A5J9V0I2_9POAL|nr:hypothetical protein EJB05_20546 [Eragrostis curvula]